MCTQNVHSGRGDLGIGKDRFSIPNRNRYGANGPGPAVVAGIQPNSFVVWEGRPSVADRWPPNIRHLASSASIRAEDKPPLYVDQSRRAGGVGKRGQVRRSFPPPYLPRTVDQHPAIRTTPILRNRYILSGGQAPALLVTKQEDLNPKIFVQTGRIETPAVYEASEINRGKTFDQKARKGRASPMTYGQPVHDEHAAQAGPGEQANVAIKDKHGKVAQHPGTGKIGKPDIHNQAEGYMRELKPVPPWVADEDAHDYLNKKHGAQVLKYTKIAEPAWGKDITLYLDWYRPKD